MVSEAIAVTLAAAAAAAAAAAVAAMAVGPPGTAAVAPESIVACADEAADEAAGAAVAAAVADMLAAMAAAAIANGAVAFPEGGDAAPEGAGAAGGASVTGTTTGIAVAMAVAAVVASCSATVLGSIEAPVAEASPDDDFAADLAVSDFELADFALEGWGALGLGFALDGCVALAFGWFELASWLLLAVDGFEGAAFCDPPLFAAAGVLLEGDCRVGCCCVVGVVLLGSLALLLPTSAPKMPFPWLESDLADLGAL